MGTWILARWLAVGAVVVIVAFVVGFAFGLPNSGGVLAQDTAPSPTPTVPPLPTPTSAELDAMIAANPNIPQTLTIRMIDSVTGLPMKDEPVAAPQRTRPTEAEAEYLASDPERAIYLYEIDRVIHLPEGFVIWWVYNDGYFSRECSPGYLMPRCPIEPAYHLKRVENGKKVGVDSAGYVFVVDSDTLPAGFGFLSDLEVIHVDANPDY